MGLDEKGNAEVAFGPLHRLQAPNYFVSCHHHEYVAAFSDLRIMQGHLLGPLPRSRGASNTTLGCSPTLSPLRGFYVTTRIHHCHWQSDGGTCMSSLGLHVQLGIDQRMWRVQPSFSSHLILPNTARQLRQPRSGAHRGQPRILIYHPAVSLALQQPPILSLALIPR